MRRKRSLPEPERMTRENFRKWTDSAWKADEYLKATEREGLPLPSVGSGCKRCGRPYQEFPTHSVSLTADGSGVGILCEICWVELDTDDDRLRWLLSWWWFWHIDDLYNGCPMGKHTDGLPPFERGHYSYTREDFEAAIRQPIALDI